MEERLRELESEKNALLDYIEENIEKTRGALSPLSGRSAESQHNLTRLKLLEQERNTLFSANEDLKEDMVVLKEKHRVEIGRLQDDLEEAHKLINLRLEEY
jgi:phage portal protein BeeE